MSSTHAAIMISCRLPVRRKHPPLSGCAWRVSFVFVDIPKGRGMQWQDGGRAGLCLGGAAWWWHGDNMLALLLFFFFVGSIFSVCFLDCFPFFCIVSLFVSCFLPCLSFFSFLLLLEFSDYCQFFLLVFEDIFADFFFFFFLLLNSSATLVLSTPYIRVVSLSSSFTLYGPFCPSYLRVNTPLTSLSSNASHVPCLRRIVGLRSLNPTLYIEVIFIPRRFTSARLSRLGFGMSVSAQGLLHPRRTFVPY